MKILVIRFLGLGDLILMTALSQSLRSAYPDATMDLATFDSFEEVMRLDPSFDRIHSVAYRPPLRRLLEFGRSLRHERYDLIVDSQVNLRSTILVAVLGNGLRTKRLRHPYLTRWLVRKGLRRRCRRGPG